jgi:hypothetical protein
VTVFAKIFAQIFDSSISADYVVRHVFMDLLVLADRDGVVDMTLDAIARRTNVPDEIISHAIAELMRDDRKSRSHEEKGRRLVPIDSHRDWGWQIVNYEHYRNIKDEEARRTYFRDKKREQRAKSPYLSTVSTKSPHLSNLVKDSPTLSNKVTQAEAEADTEVQKPSRVKRERQSDERHMEFKEAIRVYWDSKNPGVDMPWGPMEGKQLGMWLREAPHITLEQFRGMLRGRYKSDVNHGDRPGQWIRWVTSYGPSPVDRFNKPIQEGINGQFGETNPSPAKQRIDGARRALARIAVERGLVTASDLARRNGAALPEPGPGAEHHGVLPGLRGTGDEVFAPESQAGGGVAEDQAGTGVLPKTRRSG